jgi:hypothetical protein
MHYLVLMTWNNIWAGPPSGRFASALSKALRCAQQHKAPLDKNPRLLSRVFPYATAPFGSVSEVSASLALSDIRQNLNSKP